MAFEVRALKLLLFASVLLVLAAQNSSASGLGVCYGTYEKNCVIGDCNHPGCSYNPETCECTEPSACPPYACTPSNCNICGVTNPEECSGTYQANCNTFSETECGPPSHPSCSWCWLGGNECTGTGQGNCCYGLTCNNLVTPHKCSNCVGAGYDCSGGQTCCAQTPALICKSDTLTCEECSVETDHCGDNADCCTGLTCQSGTCTAGNNPPLKPAKPVIKPVPDVSNSGIIDCASCIVPPDPDPGDTVTLQYKWEKKPFGAGSFITLLDWSYATDSHQCSPGTCANGDQFRLIIRGMDNLGAIGPESDPSDPTRVVVPPPPPPAIICNADSYSNVMSVSALAGISVAIIVALAYMFGESFQNARMLTWAKTEAMQVIASLFIVAVILFLLSAFCNFQVGEMKTMFGFLPKIYEGANQNLKVYDAALEYTSNLMKLCLSNMAMLRYNIGAYEIRSSYTRFDCDSICLFSLQSTDVADFSGETLNMAITNNLLSTATVSYLTTAFMYFTMLYIQNGLFLEFLPLAIVIRSIPFMRQFGGALIGIFLALYFLYPVMLLADSALATGLAKSSGGAALYNMDGNNCAGKDIYGLENGATYLSCQNQNTMKTESGLENPGTGKGDMNDIAPSPLVSSIRVNVLIFLTAVFLPAINMIVIAAIGRDLTKLLGEEADLSRLGQMV